jgi:hypothetical protein
LLLPEKPLSLLSFLCLIVSDTLRKKQFTQCEDGRSYRITVGASIIIPCLKRSLPLD